jgi:ribonuclease HI
LFELAGEEGLPTNEAADRLADRRIQQVGAIQHTWL